MAERPGAISDVDLDGVHELFWTLRHDGSVAAELERDPDKVLDRYGVDPSLRSSVTSLDVRSLYLAGVNPYLLFFAALELGLSRDDYYARISLEEAPR